MKYSYRILIFCLFLFSCSLTEKRRPAAIGIVDFDPSRVYSGSCIDGVHRLVADKFLIEVSSGNEKRIPFEIPERLSKEIAKDNEAHARRIIDQYKNNLDPRIAEAANIRLSVSASGGGVLYEDGFLDISALQLTNFDVFPYTQAFTLRGQQAGIAQMPWKIKNSHINSIILENPNVDLVPHARTFIDQALRQADISNYKFFRAQNMALQVYGKSKKLRTYWIISQPHNNQFGRELYEDYINFVMKQYIERIDLPEEEAKRLKDASMDLMERSISIIVTDHRLGTFNGDGGELFRHFSITSEAPEESHILGGLSLVMSRNAEEKLPSELFRQDLAIPRVEGETLIEVTRRATKKGNRDVSPEVIFQLLAAIKGMKNSKRIVIEVDEAGYQAFQKYGFKLVAEPIDSFRGKEYTLIADVEEAYSKMVSHHIKEGYDLKQSFVEDLGKFQPHFSN